MKTIIAGSRTITNYEIVKNTIEASQFSITEIVCGMARGVDLLGLQWARENNIPVKMFPAQWELGRRAGYLRNKEMGEYADALIAIHDGVSRGTANMIQIAHKFNLPTYIQICILKDK